MTRWRRTALLSLLPACGTLDVQVAVLDPGIVAPAEDERLLEVVLPQVLGQSDKVIDQIVSDLENTHARFYITLTTEIEEKAKEVPEAKRQELTRSAQKISTEFARNQGKEYERLGGELKTNRDEIRRLHGMMLVAPKEDRVGIRAQLLKELQYRYGLAEGLREVFLRDAEQRVREIREKTRGLDDQAVRKVDLLAARRIAAARLETAQSLRSLVGSGYLLDSPYAYAVASAPENAWAPMYNRAFGSGILGNADIAIKKTHQGDFTVKGLTFDPSDVARAASKLTTQAVVLAAQIAGVPVKLPAAPAAGTPGAALAQSSAQLSDLQTQEERLRAARRTSDRALLGIARAILAEYAKLQDPAAGVQARGAIDAAYNARKGDIRIQKGAGTP